MLLGFFTGKIGEEPATPPEFVSGTVPADGATLALTFTVPVEPLLPATDAVGLTVTVDGAGATFTSAMTSNTVMTLTMTVRITAGQTVTVAYSPGDITDSDLTALASFGATACTNDSTAYAATEAIEFGGTNEYAARADAAAQDFTTAMTISVWVKGAATADYGGIFLKHDYGGGSQNSYAILRSGVVAGKAMCLIYDNTSGLAKQWHTSITAFDDSWHHIAFTFSSGTFTLYVDRVADSAPTKTVDNAITSIKNSTTGLRMGSQITGGTPANFYVGRITNASLWSVALDQAGIDALANGGKPADLALHANYASCVSWYKAGDGDTIGVDGILDTKGSLPLNPVNMEAGDIVADTI